MPRGSVRLPILRNLPFALGRSVETKVLDHHADYSAKLLLTDAHFGITVVMVVVSDLTVAIAAGTAVELAQRMMRRDLEPAEWTPPDQ